MRYLILHAKIPLDDNLASIPADSVKQLADMVKEQLDTIGAESTVTIENDDETIPVTKHGPCDVPVIEISYVDEATGETCQTVK